MKATDAAGFGRRRRWGSPLLVGGQVAVSVVLLAVATFVYRDFQQRLGSGPGFRTDHLLSMWFDPSLLQFLLSNRTSTPLEPDTLPWPVRPQS